MKRIIVSVLLLALAGIISSRAQTNAATNAVATNAVATNTVVTIQQGTNTSVTVLQGTNVQIIVKQGAVPVAVNVISNTIPTPPPAPRWVGEAVASLTITRGNSDLTLFTAKVTEQKKTPFNEYLLEGDAAYGVNENDLTAESAHGSAQYNHLFSPQFYGFANVDALHDDIQAIWYRISINPGAGYYFVKNKWTTFDVEAGPGIVDQNEGIVVDGHGDYQTIYGSIRGAERLDQKISASARMWEKAEIIAQANKEDNYYANLEIGVETAVTKSFSLQVTLDDYYVNEAATGRKKNDTKLVSGVVYKF